MIKTEHAVAGTNWRIVDEAGYRKLMVQGDDDAVMTAMRLDAPDALVHAYTIAMLQSLLFRPDPADVTMIGLGGGQQAKFIRARLPDTRVVAVELDPVMVGIARSWFGVPADDERLSVLVGDGNEYIRNHPDSCDIILSDGCDQSYRIAGSLACEGFYRACRRSLRRDGVMAMNVPRHDRAWRDAQVALLMRIFSWYLTLDIGTEQSVLLVFRDPPQWDLQTLAERADRLEPQFGLGLPRFVRDLSALAEQVAGKDGTSPAPGTTHAA